MDVNEASPYTTYPDLSTGAWKIKNKINGACPEDLEGYWQTLAIAKAAIERYETKMSKRKKIVKEEQVDG